MKLAKALIQALLAAKDGINYLDPVVAEMEGAIVQALRMDLKCDEQDAHMHANALYIQALGY